MQAHKTVSRIRSALAQRETSLVAIVRLLTDLVARDGCRPPDVDAADARAVAELAAAVAGEAQGRLEEQERRIAALERQAMTDSLTGLLNRRGIEMALHTALAAARRYEEQGVLVSIDLDGFKLVNDTYGHAVGDKVLAQIARVLGDGVRGTDSVGRIGGDEFVVLLTRVSPEDGLKRAHGLEAQLNGTAVNIDGRTILVRASCGIQTFGGNDDGATLLDRADTAMYRRKRARMDQRHPAPVTN